MLSYRDKTAVVSGASSGIGAACAKLLARRGACVVLVARREEHLREVADAIVDEGGAATVVLCDVTDSRQIQSLTTLIREKHPAVDLLVNNAGRELTLPLQLTRDQHMADLMQLNLMSVAALTRDLLGSLARGSSVVNVASLAGLRGSPGQAFYAATKGAVVALTRSLARELAPRGIRMNAVCPGMVKSAMSDRIFARLTPQMVADLESRYPLGFGTPEDVAEAVAFLGSDAARWITGQCLTVDGGFSA